MKCWSALGASKQTPKRIQSRPTPALPTFNGRFGTSRHIRSPCLGRVLLASVGVKVASTQRLKAGLKEVFQLQTSGDAKSSLLRALEMGNEKVTSQCRTC